MNKRDDNVLPFQRKIPIQNLDQFTYHHTLAAQRGTSVVMFTKSGCQSCAMWIKLLTQFKTQHQATTVFRVDTERDPGLARELDLFHLPALFLYRDGEYHAALQSEAKLDKFAAAVEAALGAPAQEHP